jgi:hypothetical protein
MIISLVQRPESTRMCLKLGDEVLEQVTQYKYLGVTVDESLGFSQHTRQTVRKVKQGIGALCRSIRKWASTKVLNTALTTIVLPSLLYGMRLGFPQQLPTKNK